MVRKAAKITGKILDDVAGGVLSKISAQRPAYQKPVDFKREKLTLKIPKRRKFKMQRDEFVSPKRKIVKKIVRKNKL